MYYARKRAYERRGVCVRQKNLYRTFQKKIKWELSIA
jgi:hypothetical protein